ncbi:MAG: ABC transporter ATPase [Bacteroidia bacterium]
MHATKAIKTNLFEGFHPNSKVWIYVSDRIISKDESQRINHQLEVFTKQWTAHDKALRGAGGVFYDRFIVLTVDELVTNASGCSIDKSVHFIKQIEIEYNLNLFDRMTFFYQTDETIKSFHFNDLINLVKSGEIIESTKIFDTTITQLGLFQSEFIKEVGKTWLAKFFK